MFPRSRCNDRWQAGERVALPLTFAGRIAFRSRQGLLAANWKDVQFGGPPTGTLQNLGRRLSEANLRRSFPLGKRIGAYQDKPVSVQAASAFSGTYLSRESDTTPINRIGAPKAGHVLEGVTGPSRVCGACPRRSKVAGQSRWMRDAGYWCDAPATPTAPLPPAAPSSASAQTMRAQPRSCNPHC